MADIGLMSYTFSELENNFDELECYEIVQTDGLGGCDIRESSIKIIKEKLTRQGIECLPGKNKDGMLFVCLTIGPWKMAAKYKKRQSPSKYTDDKEALD